MTPSAGNGSLSQWQLIQRRFRRRKLAVASLCVLGFLYLLGLLAEFVAPYEPDQRHIAYPYAPPQALRLSLTHGLHVRALVPHTDPVTFRKSYTESATAVPLGFFAKGEPTELLGVLPIERRLLGIARDRTTAADPTFFLLGADKYGRDIFSRAVHGARVSLSVGLVGIVLTFVLGMVIGGIPGRDRIVVPGPGAAPAAHQLGRDAAALPGREGRQLLPLAADAGGLHRQRGAVFQLPGRRAA